MYKIARTYIALMRPHQWLKNLLLLFPPFFAGEIDKLSLFKEILPSLLSFSLAASCGYIVNDIKDRKLDVHHSHKRMRPIARGDISIHVASILAALLYFTAMILAGSVSARFEGYLILYLFISFFYTMYFKDMVIIDIFFISFGFLIRVLAGGEAFNIRITNWLFLTVFLVALFLATGKRLGELILMEGTAHKQRRSLSQYSSPFLEGLLWFSASAALVTYSLYTIDNARKMFYTVPIATFGLIRYIFIVKEGKGDPTEALLKDWQIMVTGLAWVALIGSILYRK